MKGDFEKVGAGNVCRDVQTGRVDITHREKQVTRVGGNVEALKCERNSWE